MKRFLQLLILLALAGCTVQEPPQAGPAEPSPAPQAGIIPGQAVVLVTEERADSFGIGDFAGISEEMGIRSAERVFPAAGEFEARHRAAGLHRWYRISYDRTVPATKARQGLGGVAGIEAVAFPRRKARRSYFNDPQAYLQWNLRNDGSLGGHFMRGIDINVEPVRRDYTAGSSEVIVAVIDGGIDLAHEDLPGVVLPPGEDGGSRNFVAGYEPGQIPADDHGTHVGGVIGAVNNNRTGVSGIAGGKDGRGGVRLMSCVIFGEEESEGDAGDEDAQALVWAADHGAVIANNSWGYVFDSPEDAAQGARDFEQWPSPTKSAIDYFIDHAGTDASGAQTGPMKGGVVFFASGNTGWDHDAPSEYGRVFAVGAVGPDGKMALYSTYGPWVDILAPGGSDADLDGSDEWILSCVPDNMPGYAPYAFMPGTSMACPHAAGVAALLVSYFGGPGFTNEDLLERMVGGMRTGVIDQQGRACGGGLLDAAGSFEYIPTPVDPDKPVITFSTDYTGDFRFRSHEQISISWRIHGNERTKYPVRVESDCPAVTADCNVIQAQLHIDALRAEPGTYSATILVGDVARKQVSFTILENHAPLRLSPIDNQILNAASNTICHLELGTYFEDPDGEQLHYSVSLAQGGIATTRISDSTLSLSPAGYGQTTVTVTASDARGASCSTTFQLLARNTYQALDVYPNPVHDFLYVRPDAPRPITATLFSRSGAQVLAQTAQAGPFQPLRLDVNTLPAGTYTLRVDYNVEYGMGAREVINIVKY